jgi:hypothetical protein
MIGGENQVLIGLLYLTRPRRTERERNEPASMPSRENRKLREAQSTAATCLNGAQLEPIDSTHGTIRARHPAK